MRGTELLNELSDATGLPNEMIGEELSRLISGAGKSTDNVTLDELRELLGCYLQDVLLEARNSFESDVEAHDEVQAAAASIVKDGSQSSAVVVSINEKAVPTFTMFNDLGSTAPDFIGES